ncbi:MAG: diguanylate cyclase [Clostridia bacterium]|nr:diguanylate cyclase [Clostridia bacterium]
MSGLIGGSFMLKESISTWRQERDEYFKEGASDIVRTNMMMLFQVSFAITVLTGLLILLTPYIIIGWTPTVQHVLLVPVSAFFCFISMYYKSRPKQSTFVVNFMCLTYIGCIFCFVIAMDTFQLSDMPSSFVPVLLIAIPALFVFRFRIIYMEMIIFEIAYVVVLYDKKTLAMAQNDFFNSVVGLLTSAIVAFIIQRLRAQSYMAQNQYKRLSMTDGLTGIMNKSNSEYVIRQYLECRGTDDNCALLILDVDDFKLVNDTMGHQVGDDILGGMGKILQQTFRSTDTLGRFGGDEFIILMRHIPEEEIVEKKCEKIFSKIRELSKKYNYKLSCSIGISFLKGETASYERVFQIADTALYEAKASGKAKYAMHAVNETYALKGDKPLMLIADDNEINREILKLALQSDYEIVEADTGSRTLEQIGRFQEKLAIVLLDLVMPDGDGYQVLKYMKNRRNIEDIPVVVISADSRSEKDVLQLGAADMIAKPFDAEIVQIRVRNALKSKMHLKKSIMAEEE